MIFTSTSVKLAALNTEEEQRKLMLAKFLIESSLFVNHEVLNLSTLAPLIPTIGLGDIL